MFYLNFQIKNQLILSEITKATSMLTTTTTTERMFDFMDFENLTSLSGSSSKSSSSTNPIQSGKTTDLSTASSREVTGQIEPTTQSSEQYLGDLISGTYCSKTFSGCDKKKCRLQSPNFPGLYPRNLTCYYAVSFLIQCILFRRFILYK